MPKKDQKDGKFQKYRAYIRINYGNLKSLFLLFNEKIQITKFLPKIFCRDFQQISMSLVKIGQNK